MRVYSEGGELFKQFYDFVFEDKKNTDTTLQIVKLMLERVREVRKKSCPLQKLKIWGDNASDLKSGDVLDQWRKVMKVDVELHSLELRYHAPGEGKTQLDAHFGHFKGKLARYDRGGHHKRETIHDLLKALEDFDATNIVHVKVDLSSQNVVYPTRDGIKKFYDFVIDKKGNISAREDVGSDFKPIELDKVKQRNGIREKKMRKEILNNIEIPVEQCQACGGKRKGKDDNHHHCYECDRFWHKKCVWEEGTAAENQTWENKCAKCGGFDPGVASVREAIVPSISICMTCCKPIRGNRHKECKKKRKKLSDDHIVQSAEMLQMVEPSVSQKPFVEGKIRREGRRSRKNTRKRKKTPSKEQEKEIMQGL
jgi:hypothetical protein